MQEGCVSKGSSRLAGVRVEEVRLAGVRRSLAMWCRLWPVKVAAIFLVLLVLVGLSACSSLAASYPGPEDTLWVDTVEPAPADPGPAPSDLASETGRSEGDIPAFSGEVVKVDVVVYATQTSGLAAVRELALGTPRLRVALVSCGRLLETPLAQGLGAEDARNIDRISGGFYGEWRQAVTAYYRRLGKKPFNSAGRFVYEPEAASQTLWSYLSPVNAPKVNFYSAKLIAASDQGSQRFVDIQVEDGRLVRLLTTYFIDASVEADLARMLGADYRIGRIEEVYNDIAGRTAPYPTPENGFITAPQRLSALLTLKVHSGRAGKPIALLDHPNYDPATYPGTILSRRNVEGFANSWSMKIATLPYNKRELNESWTDWPDVGLAFEWVFAPEKRGDIRKRVLTWTINRARYLQENGYPQVGLASIPQKLYVREGPRIVGLETYTAAEIRAGTVLEPVAVGCYCEYDRHDSFVPTQVETSRYVYVPMKALMAAGHPWLLVSTAVSTDCAAYSSAVRMEHTRANMGAAAAMIVLTASELGLQPSEVPYEAVWRRLTVRGYSIPGL